MSNHRKFKNRIIVLAALVMITTCSLSLSFVRTDNDAPELLVLQE